MLSDRLADISHMHDIKADQQKNAKATNRGIIKIVFGWNQGI